MTLIDQKSRTNSFCFVVDAATEYSASLAVLGCSSCAGCLYIFSIGTLFVRAVLSVRLIMRCRATPSPVPSISRPGQSLAFCASSVSRWRLWSVSQHAGDCALSRVSMDMLCVRLMMYCRCSVSPAAQISRPGQSVRLLHPGGAFVARELACRVSGPSRYVLTMTCALNSGCCPVSDVHRDQTTALLCSVLDFTIFDAQRVRHPSSSVQVRFQCSRIPVGDVMSVAGLFCLLQGSVVYQIHGYTPPRLI